MVAPVAPLAWRIGAGIAAAVARAAGRGARAGRAAPKPPGPPPPVRPPVPPQFQAMGLGSAAAAPASTGALGFLTSGRLVNGLYTGAAIASTLRTLAGFVAPQFYHEITVAVKGGPNASMQRVWQIACALTWGQYRYRPPSILQAHNLECTWDLTSKAVKISCSYTLGFQSDFGAREFIQRGPLVETVGAYWPQFMRPGAFFRLLNPEAANQQQELVGNPNGPLGAAPGAPADQAVDNAAREVFGDGFMNQFGEGEVIRRGDGPGVINRRVQGGRVVEEAPDNPRALAAAVAIRRQQLRNAGLDGQFDALPDNGRLLLTEIKGNPDVQPPAPDDYSDLISLVANSLTDPGFLPPLPPDGRRFGNPGGVQVLPNNSVDVQVPVLYGKLRNTVTPPIGVVATAIQGVIAIARQFGLQLQRSIDGYLKRDRAPLARGPEHDGR